MLLNVMRRLVMGTWKDASFDTMQRLYQFGSKQAKKEMLDHLVIDLRRHRKSLIRRLNNYDLPRRPGPGRPPVYVDSELIESLKVIWLATDQLCGKRLKAALPLWLPHYERGHGELANSTRSQLLVMSSATIDRLLKPLKLKHKKHGLGGTRPGTLLKNQIPIKTHNWDITQPGFMEVDTVAHCGNSLLGNFIWSITFTDIYSGWTEVRATWNKGAEGVLTQIKILEASLPFELKGFDCDNGSEFLNYHLLRYFSNREKPVGFTRSRPYKKNDNAHVEQKNWTHVRHLLGYDRLEDPRLVEYINDLYSNEWSLLQNFFMPSMKLTEKTRINSRYKREYSNPCTPYERLILSESISENKKIELKETNKKLNPFELKKEIERKLKKIFYYVNVSNKVRMRI